jgi:hypothetical protein
MRRGVESGELNAMPLWAKVREYKITTKQPNWFNRLLGVEAVTRVEFDKETEVQIKLAHDIFLMGLTNNTQPRKTKDMLGRVNHPSDKVYEVTGETDRILFIRWLINNNLGIYPFPDGVIDRINQIMQKNKQSKD